MRCRNNRFSRRLYESGGEVNLYDVYRKYAKEVEPVIAEWVVGDSRGKTKDISSYFWSDKIKKLFASAETTAYREWYHIDDEVYNLVLRDNEYYDKLAFVLHMVGSYRNRTGFK